MSAAQDPTASPAGTPSPQDGPARGIASPSPALSEGYPSWLPKRPPHPAPQSTLQSSTGNMYASAADDVPAEPSPTIPPLWGGRKPTPRSVRIVKTREATDQTRVWSRATGTGVSPTIVAQGLRSTPRPRFRAPSLHLELLRDPSWRARVHFVLFPFFVFAHVPLQTFFDFNAAFVLVELARYPNPAAPGVAGSGSGWALAAAAYVACWAIWLFGVFIGYELIYSFYRRWRYRRPLVMPLYLSAPAHNFVSMSSFTHFCFFRHIRTSAVPVSHARAVLPSAEGSWRDLLAETCFFYSQNLPTVALLLPRAGIALAVLLTFWTPVILPDGRPLPDIAPVVALRDNTFFDPHDGALSGYAKGVLAANAAWAAWRIFVLLVSWFGLWILSGYGCAGLCGPATRWEEEQGERAVSMYSEKDVEAAGELPWQWKECTALRVQEAFDFCLTIRRTARKEVPDAGAVAAADEGVERVLAAAGLGVPGPSHAAARRGMLSQELFEAPENAHAEASGPYPFTGFGPQKDAGAARSSSGEQVPFPPSPADEDEEVAGEEEYTGEEGEEYERRTSAEQPSTSGRASNSLSSLGQPIPGRYPFTFRHPARGGSLSSAGAFSSSTPSHAHSHSRHTPQSKSTSSNTGASRISRSTGNGESSTSDSPLSAAIPDVPSPAGISARMPMPPRHPAAPRGRGRAGTVPAPTSPTPAAYGQTRVRTGTHTSESGTDVERSVLYESELETSVLGPLDLGVGDDDALSHRSDTRSHHSDARSHRSHRSGAPRTGSASPSPSSLLALEREGEDSVGLLSARTSSSGLRSRRSSGTGSRSRHSSGPGSRSPRSSGPGSRSPGLGSRRSSGPRHSSPSSVSLERIRQRTQSLIQSIGSASRSSIEGVRSRTQSLVRIRDAETDQDQDQGAYTSEDGGRAGTGSEAENYTFGVPAPGWRHAAVEEREGAQTEDMEEKEAASESGRSGSRSGGSRSGGSQLRAAPSSVSQAATITTATTEDDTHVLGVPSSSALQTPVATSPVAIPRADGTRFLSIPERPSAGMLSTAAPSFVTEPATVESRTETSGRTPSSWGGDDYMHGRSMKPL
ncbi:hypothetical protein K488DRAFT_85134 [Vararia minispora EC-137]|uniref:Uncharacterized protein n=1 Tax=Vararia minispora EC-137 TaxID=1314806 RepID=A0ACB8QNK8_9AGAM|nr:hypothetical protein K488DRAFT_85134 [Vararia minispora EC-137]